MEHTSIFDSIYLFFVTRTSGEYFLLSLFVLLPLLLYLARLYARHRQNVSDTKQFNFVMEQLSTAHQQIGTFDIQVGAQDTRTNYMAILDSVTKNFLTFNVAEYMSPLWVDQKAEFFFWVRRDKRRDFYKFTSTILSIDPSDRITLVKALTPHALQMGQKRSFFRMTPLPNSIRVVAVWFFLPGQSLPRTTADIGNPVLRSTFKPEDGPDTYYPVTLEDISGSGLGLRIHERLDDEGFVKGEEILCLLVFNESLQEEEHLVNFCCTGRISNVRQPEREPSKILGVEFTNWALLERGNPAITWFSQQKATGIGPILHWVTRMEIERRKYS